MARKAKQETLPGMQREKVPELQESAEDYRALRDEEIQVGEKAKAAKGRLIQLMRQHGRTVFVYLDEEGNERRVDLTTKDNAKVKKISSRGDDSPPDSSSGTGEGAGVGGGGGGDVEVS